MNDYSGYLGWEEVQNKFSDLARLNSDVDMFRVNRNEQDLQFMISKGVTFSVSNTPLPISVRYSTSELYWDNIHQGNCSMRVIVKLVPEPRRRGGSPVDPDMLRNIFANNQTAMMTTVDLPNIESLSNQGKAELIFSVLNSTGDDLTQTLVNLISENI